MHVLGKQSDVIDRVLSMEEGEKLLLLSPVHPTEERDLATLVKIMEQQGFSRLKTENGIVRIDEFSIDYKGLLYLVVDRVVVQTGEDFINRLSDSVQTAFYEGKGECILENVRSGEQLYFSNRFEKDGITFMEPNIHFFSFNNPYGACPKCEGYGNTIGIDEDLVIPNNTLFTNPFSSFRKSNINFSGRAMSILMD